MPKRLSRQFIVALWGLAAACNALAMGFGALPESVAFGRPLDLLVPLNIGADEPLDAACLSAEVEIGDRRLPARAVQVVAEPAAAAGPSRRLRIQSLQVVDEPVVGISVSAGCRDKVTRQFTVLADPVDRAAPLPAMVAVLPGSTASAAPLPQPRREAPGVAPAALKVSAASANRGQRRSRATARVSKAANGGAVGAPNSRPSVRAALPVTARAAVKPSAPRLQLDRADKVAILPVAPANVSAELDEALAGARAAQAAASVAASAAAQRLALVERDMQQLQAAASANQATAALVRARLGAAAGQNQWVPTLAVLLAVLAGVALWLGGRVRTLQRERQAGWAAAHAPLPTSASSMLSSMPLGLDDSSTTLRALPQESSWVAAVSSEQAAAALALPDAPQANGASPSVTSMAEVQAATRSRSVSVEELIDLEQRAEFFTVLGQDESAIDLLMAHLRSTGGASPLPYLKLLEIYRRRDERGAYERTRTRFNHRFNARAPEWEREPEQGRTLIEYDAVMSRLQAAWRTPVDDMAELENLLFHKTSEDLFELPAYRDVLVLYAVARDLNKTSGTTASDVDVLLPLLGDPRDARLEALQLHAPALDGSEARDTDRPNALVDLDLDEPPSSRESAFSVLTPVTVSLRRAH
jgi:pilus assembly protein FimV